MSRRELGQIEMNHLELEKKKKKKKRKKEKRDRFWLQLHEQNVKKIIVHEVDQRHAKK